MSSSEKVTIDDFLVLGNAVPDELRDGRTTVCVAGLSKKLGLIRIYPVPTTAPMRRWNIVEVPLERNSQDTREESWKIQGSKSEWDTLDTKIRVIDKIDRDERIALIDEFFNSPFGYSCVEELNEQKKSLGIIKPEILSCQFEDRAKYDDSVQMTLTSPTAFKTIKSYKDQPRITYRCSGCKLEKPHDQQVLEWGVYEWMRRNPSNLNGVWESLHITDKEYEKMFLVGNQARRRNAFMIISIFRHKIG